METFKIMRTFLNLSLISSFRRDTFISPNPRASSSGTVSKAFLGNLENCCLGERGVLKTPDFRRREGVRTTNKDGNDVVYYNNML